MTTPTRRRPADRSGVSAVAPRKPRAPRQNREHEEQAAFFTFVRCWSQKYPGLKWVHAIPNESGYLSPAQRGKKKAEGKTAGIWDVAVPLPQKIYTEYHKKYWAITSGRILYLEFKSETGKLSDEQKAFRAAIEGDAYRFAVVRSWIEAAKVLGEYLGIPDSETDFWRPLR